MSHNPICSYLRLQLDGFLQPSHGSTFITAVGSPMEAPSIRRRKPLRPSLPPPMQMTGLSVSSASDM